MKKSLLIMMLILSMMLAACSGNESSGSKGKEKGKDTGTPDSSNLAEEQVLNLYASGEIPSMDSSQATDTVSFTIMNNTFEGLYRLDVENKPVPGVAKSYSVSDDNLVYTFELNENAKWSNGDPVTAHDFVYSWKKALHPDTLSQYAYIMGVVKNANGIQTEGDPLYGKVDELGIKAIDDHKLEVTLEYPAPYFLSLTGFATFYPQNQKYVESQGKNYALEADTMIYNGPFVMSEWKHNEGWVMEKNDQYWDKENVILDKINQKVVKDTATMINLFETGDIDYAKLTAEYVDQYKDHEDFYTSPDPVMYFLRLNQKNKALANLNIRKAIDSGWDKESHAKVILNDGSKAAYYFIPSDFTKNPDGEDFRKINGDFGSYDIKKAQEYWKKGLEEIGEESLTLELLNYDDDTSKKTGEYIKNQLEKNLPGLTVNIKAQPFKQKLALETKMDYDFSYAGWGPDYDDPMTYLDMFLTNGGHNEMAYSNPKYDELVKSALKEADAKKRFEMLLEAEKVFMEDQAISPMFQDGTAALLRGYVKNRAEHVFGGDFTYKWTYIEKH
ncbi:peptide ABC transporter substrate-binding protein [Fictibacillus sp. BK138]|uniref:peptide ABC transporter substrate-binding protein n=1 Tax=Fictibacillus sp. BK138 TaxID=2512121 RepID=UPI0010ED0E22|nr:peptide ABC transporter substrate-binding protein [Fictibacillus sp. BK138]RZT15492.1 oligopeptide transport system substrate-binding protein [Fictibacillus sp. BK138]